MNDGYLIELETEARKIMDATRQLETIKRTLEQQGIDSALSLIGSYCLMYEARFEWIGNKLNAHYESEPRTIGGYQYTGK